MLAPAPKHSKHGASHGSAHDRIKLRSMSVIVANAPHKLPSGQNVDAHAAHGSGAPNTQLAHDRSQQEPAFCSSTTRVSKASEAGMRNSRRPASQRKNRMTSSRCSPSNLRRRTLQVQRVNHSSKQIESSQHWPLLRNCPRWQLAHVCGLPNTQVAQPVDEAQRQGEKRLPRSPAR